MTIGDVIREKRKELEMTQEDLAKAVGATSATVSRWESGDIHKMKASSIKKVAETLGISVRLFFQRTEILTEDEEHLIDSYRNADEGTKGAIRKLLDV